MKRMINKAVLAAAVVFVTSGAAYVVPEVTNVVMTQRAGSRIVDITYDLTGEAAIVTLGIETNGVALPDSAVTRLVGDVCSLVATGTTKSIVWNVGADWPENLTQTAKAKVTAWQTNAPPQIMVIDLTGEASADNYPVTYHVSAEALPYGGLTNAVYKSAYLVMRKNPAGGFNMGDGTSTVAVALSQDFYTSVFQVTQGQWFKVMGKSPASFIDVASRALRPVERVSYDNIRGSSSGADWPASNTVDTDSFVGQLRMKTGVSGLDLPTEAQWEYACRAGAETCFNDGDAVANVIGENHLDNAWLDALGRYKFNGGYIDGETEPPAGCGPDSGPAIVGSYLPNAWGLYDMHGNVWEWCLDWFADSLEGGEDPKGAVSGSARVRRGGSWLTPASSCRSANRTSAPPNIRNNYYGFRLVNTLP